MEKQNRIYIALLNQGWLRSELFVYLLNTLQDLNLLYFLETPMAQPVDNNRNQIVQRFLKSKCTHLLMIDHDVVPSNNIFELIKQDKDIIIYPVPIQQEEQIMFNIYNLDNEGYWIEVDKQDGLFEISAGGTGCILIKKNVLEKIKAPFERKYNKDGIAELGQDLFFCTKAQQEGFKIYSHFDYTCSHYKTINLIK